MNYKYSIKIIVGLVIVSFNINFAQIKIDTLKCNIKILKSFNESLDSLQINIAKEFFLTFNDTCSNNTEYSEWSNELLFDYLAKYPKNFIEVLSLDEKYQLNIIYKNLESPINDNYDLENIYKKIEMINTQSPIKKEILKRIKIALIK